MRVVLRALPLVLLLAAFPAHGFAESCVPTDTRLCLQGGQFQVEVVWTVPGLGSGPGHAVPLSDDTGTFWFFDNANVELVLKVLDGQQVNGNYWVYYGGLSDVSYRVTVTDVRSSMKRTYDNPSGRLVSRADTEAFKAEPPAPLTAKITPVPPEGGNPSPPPSPLLRRGSELQFNVTTPGEQRSPSVALGPDGAFMVAWAGQTSRASDFDIYGRFYDAEGRPLSGEVRLHADNLREQIAVSAAASPTGEYMAVWVDFDPTSGTGPIVGRVFNATGQPLGGEFRIGTEAPYQSRPAIVTDPAGGFLVAWSDPGNAAFSLPSSIRWQRFGSQGQRVGVEKAIQRAGRELRVAASPAGGFVLAWIEEASADFETDVLALRLDRQGVPLDNQALRVNADGARIPGYHFSPVPVFHLDDGFSVVWQTFVFGNRPGVEGTYAHRYDAQSRPAGPAVSLAAPVEFASPPALAALPSGETLMVWFQGELAQDPDGGVFGQLFDPSWSPAGGRSRINTYTDYFQIEPALAISSGGDLVAAWSSGTEPPTILAPPNYGLGTQDGDFYGVFGQRFTQASCALDATQLCLNGRFRVEVRFTDPRNGQPGAAQAIPLTSDTGAFWFFGEENVELVLKVLDGRIVNGHYWIYYGALSDVQYTITVTDTETGEKQTYENAPGRLASRADTEAFPLP